MIDQALRKTVDQLLRRSSDRKLHRGSSAEALAQAEQAFALAHGKPGLGEPWRAVTAYRKAMLLLRTESADAMILREVNELLLEAVIASEEHTELELGPWAKLFRLPVLHRLRAISPEEVSDREVREAFRECVEFLSNPETDSESHPHQHFRLQTQAFNCLELAAIFLGISTTCLEGRGADIDLIPLRGEAWLLFNGKSAAVSDLCTRGMALTELDVLIENTRDSFGFVHPASEGSQGELWGPGRTKVRVPKSITAILKKDLGLPDSIGGAPPEQRGIYRTRCKEALATLTGLDTEKFVGPGGQRISIPEGITLFGVVERGG